MATTTYSFVDYDHCVRLLDHPDPVVRLYAVYWFDIHPQYPLPGLFLDRLADPDEKVVCRALDTIGTRLHRPAAPAVLRLFDRSYGAVAGHCAFALGKLKFKEAVPSLAMRIYDISHMDIFLGVCYALGEIGGELAEDTLYEALNAFPDEYFAEYLLIALLRVGGPKYIRPAVDRYMEIPQVYVEGRNTLQWFWQASGLESFRELLPDNWLYHSGPTDWLQAWSGAYNHPALADLTAHLPEDQTLAPASRSMEHLLEALHKAMPKARGPFQVIPFSFLQAFYANRDWTIKRSAALQKEEACFATACFAACMAPLPEFRLTTLSDSELIRTFQQASPLIQDRVDREVARRIDRLLPEIAKLVSDTAPASVARRAADRICAVVRCSDGEQSRNLVLTLLQGVAATDSYVSRTCQEALVYLGPPAVQAIMDSLSDLDPALRACHAELAGRIPCRLSAELLLANLESESGPDPYAIACALLDLGCKEAIETLRRRLTPAEKLSLVDPLRILCRLWSAPEPSWDVIPLPIDRDAAPVAFLMGHGADLSPGGCSSSGTATVLPFRADRNLPAK